MQFFQKQKHAQSEVISAVLLILIVIAAIVVIMAFIIPFVTNQLSESDCIKVVGDDKISVVNNQKYTCYDSANKKMRVQIFLGDIEDKIKSFKIELGGAETKAIEIINNTGKTSELCMYDSSTTNKCSQKNIEIPGKNEQKTYVIAVNNLPEIVKVYPVLKNKKVCSSTNSFNSVLECEM